MSLLATGLAAVTVAAWAAFAVDFLLGRRRVPRLTEIEPRPGGSPSVSVVIPARDEAGSIERALRSVLALDYEALEVVAVDDRSTDGTGEILDRLAATDDRLTVLHVERLPDGWLGKTWALEQGAHHSGGEILLFTDADVVFEPSALGRAVALLEARGLDHLTAAGDVETSGPLLALFVATFALCFNGFFRPWHAQNPKRREAVGLGVFNLVRRAAWERAGTHAAIRTALDDDLRLGRRLKASGARQLFADASGLLSVEWYPSLGAAVRGLEKNSLAAVDGSWALLTAGGIAQLTLIAWPFLGVALTSGAARWLNLVTVALVGGVHALLLRRTRLGAWTALGLPLGIVLFVYATQRAAWLTWRRGGVRWRGTFYPSDGLRPGAGREGD